MQLSALLKPQLVVERLFEVLSSVARQVPFYSNGGWAGKESHCQLKRNLTERDSLVTVPQCFANSSPLAPVGTCMARKPGIWPNRYIICLTVTCHLCHDVSHVQYRQTANC